MNRSTPIPETVTLHVPFRVVKRGGRKEMQVPEGTTQPRRTDSTLVKALARAFRWKRMLESGEFATIAELAEREGIASSYLTRVLRLTLLAPEIVEAILDGKQGPEVTLVRVLEPFPAKWAAQGAHFGCLDRLSPGTGFRRRRSEVQTIVSGRHHARFVVVPDLPFGLFASASNKARRAEASSGSSSRERTSDCAGGPGRPPCGIGDDPAGLPCGKMLRSTSVTRSCGVVPKMTARSNRRPIVTRFTPLSYF
jgi:hypothetical protein